MRSNTQWVLKREGMAASETVCREMKPEIKNLKERLRTEAKKLVFEVFPEKIMELDNKLKGDVFSVQGLLTVGGCPKLPVAANGPVDGTDDELERPATKKRKLEDQVEIASVPRLSAHTIVPCNPKMAAMVEYLKPEIIGLVDKCNVIKTWIQMMVPKIEDGNNFGVGIQEDILAEVGKSEADAGSYLEQLSRYYTSRAKILSKCAKYPFLNDYQRAVDEYDQKVFVSFKLILRELRNIYIVVYDVTLKNYEKIVHPRSENSASLY